MQKQQVAAEQRIEELYSNFSKMAQTDDAHGMNDFSYERPETAGLRSDVHRLSVKSAMHMGINDFSLFMRRPVRDGILEPRLQTR